MSDWLADLAARVHSALSRHQGIPGETVLRHLLQTMYFSSLRTEESQPITFQVCYIDPDNPDPSPPGRIVGDRWNHVSLHTRVPLNIANVTKLAKASDPRSSSLAVYHDASGQLYVWGLIDQGNRYYDFITYNSDDGPERPGLFQASIAGVGHIVVYDGYELLADFRVDELRGSPINALAHGPIFEALTPGIQRYVDAVRLQLAPGVYEDRDHWYSSLVWDWLNALRQLLLRIQQYRHGGAVLITPDIQRRGLNVKYEIDYPRFRGSLERKGVYTIRSTYADDKIFNHHVERRTKIPPRLWLEASNTESSRRDARNELNGALWFVSLLSRVDGLVLLTPDLEVRGFGVEIQTSDAPNGVYRASDAEASHDRLVPINYNHFGTRHRSMMRYCASVPGSVGFVVSQDGDVRAMTLIEDVLVMWDSVQLRLDDFRRHQSQQD